MESVQVLESNGVSRMAMVSSNSNCNEDVLSNVLEDNNSGEKILGDLDSILEVIYDRLTISRMVSDSVIKGMVSAVSQEAVEVVAAKELEIAELKEVLRCQKNAGNGFVVEHGDVRESLCALNRAAKEQLERLGEDIANLKGNDSVQISDTRSAFYSLKATLEAMSQQVDAIVPAKDLKAELEICGQVEAMVFCAIFQSMREDYEKRTWDVDAILGLVDRFKEISTVRHELDSIQKYFSGTESRSQEIDHVHRKVLSNHGPLWDKKCEESKFSLPETLETSQLKHMAKEELYNHFRIQITKMKREHESTVQQMTEEYFAQKRAILKEMELQKERGPFAVFRKEKDFEELRKKISIAILKLDDILVDSEKLSEFCNHSREILDNLLYENRRFRALLNDQEQKLCHLSLQASDATKTEESLRKLVGHLKSSLEDAHIETAVCEEVYDCILHELALQIKPNHEDLDLVSLFMQDIIGIIYEEAGRDAEVFIRTDYRDSNPDSILMQHICEIVYQQVLRDASTEFTRLQKNFLEQEKSLVFLESKISNSEKGLQMAGEENKKLSLHVSELENFVTVKDKLLFEATTALAREKKQFELINEERIQLMNLRTKHDAMLSEKNEELILLKDKLDDCQKQIDVYMIEMAELKKSISVLELEKDDVGMLRVKDREHRKQMESVVQVIEGLSKSFADFERRIAEKVCWHNVRLENSDFQLHSLIPKINILRRKTLLYKERLDKRCSDLQKAEAEVDLLGDEVDALLSLLEKIYVALDHYSPILQHYPGVIEILKLVRRELSGEGIKAVGPAA